MTRRAGDTSASDSTSEPRGGGAEFDLVLQLSLKTLHFAGELTGTELGAPARASDSRSSSRRSTAQAAAPCARSSADRCSAARPTATGSPMPGARARCSSSSTTITSASRPSARAVPAIHAEFKKAVPTDGDAATACARRSRTSCSATRARPARPGHQLRPLDVRLRPAGKRQDGDLAGHPEPARRRHRHSARARGRGQHHQVLRSGQSRSAPRARRRRVARQGFTAGRPLDPLPASAGDGRAAS